MTNDKKGRQVQIRVSQAEYDMILDAVKKGGFKTVSDYVRYKALRVKDTQEDIIKRLETIENKLD